MNILEFFFGIFRDCFNVINVDFFGLGFTWLEFLLAVLIIFVIIGFVKSVVSVGDSVGFDNVVFGLKRQSHIKNDKREKDIVNQKRGVN